MCGILLTIEPVLVQVTAFSLSSSSSTSLSILENNPSSSTIITTINKSASTNSQYENNSNDNNNVSSSILRYYDPKQQQKQKHDTDYDNMKSNNNNNNNNNNVWLQNRGPDSIGVYNYNYCTNLLQVRVNNDVVAAMTKDNNTNDNDISNGIKRSIIHNNNNSNNENNNDNNIYAEYKIQFLASVLSMRNTILQQPYVIEHYDFTTTNYNNTNTNTITDNTTIINVDAATEMLSLSLSKAESLQSQSLSQSQPIIMNNNNTNTNTTHHNSSYNTTISKQQQQQQQQHLSTLQQKRKQKQKSYLAWNGEVYQRLVEIDLGTSTAVVVGGGGVELSSNDKMDPILTSTSTTTTTPTIVDNNSSNQVQTKDYQIEDVYDSTVSDTVLVAQMIQQYVFNDSGIEDDINNSTNNYNYCQRLAYVLSLLINTEYSFCLVTSTAVYYGRDSIGKRSLLVGTSSNNSTSTTNIPQRWEVSSVATPPSSLTTDPNTTTTSTMEWTEVQPGYVFCYDWTTGITISCKLPSIPPLLSLVQSTTPMYLTPSTTRKINSIEDASFILEKLLLNAIRYRLGGIASDAQAVSTPLSSSASCSSSSSNEVISILFSGGLDSTVLAALVLQLIPTTTILKLINVSFVDDNTNTASTTTNTTTTTAADTIAAIQSYNDLKIIYPNHTIDFIQYTTDWNTIQQCEVHVQQLMYPKSTLMDTNISIALWLASSQVNNNTTTTTCTGNTASSSSSSLSKCRILFTGLGADELMGGYGRHRKAWERGCTKQSKKDDNMCNDNNNINSNDTNNMNSTNNIDTKIDTNSTTNTRTTTNTNTITDSDRWDALRTELTMDINRLWERNLGRDDRVLSDHSIEVRLPFLDVHVMNFLQNICPIEYIVDFSSSNNNIIDNNKKKSSASSSSSSSVLLGDKKILRMIALRLQLYTAANATKRAIQFGSRIAHVSDKQRFGSRRKATGESKVKK